MTTEWNIFKPDRLLSSNRQKVHLPVVPTWKYPAGLLKRLIKIMSNSNVEKSGFLWLYLSSGCCVLVRQRAFLAKNQARKICLMSCYLHKMDPLSSLLCVSLLKKKIKYTFWRKWPFLPDVWEGRRCLPGTPGQSGWGRSGSGYRRVLSPPSTCVKAGQEFTKTKGALCPPPSVLCQGGQRLTTGAAVGLLSLPRTRGPCVTKGSLTDSLTSGAVSATCHLCRCKVLLLGLLPSLKLPCSLLKMLEKLEFKVTFLRTTPSWASSRCMRNMYVDKLVISLVNLLIQESNPAKNQWGWGLRKKVFLLLHVVLSTCYINYFSNDGSQSGCRLPTSQTHFEIPCCLLEWPRLFGHQVFFIVC